MSGFAVGVQCALFASAVAVAGILTAVAVLALEIPRLSGRVVDQADVLSAAEEAALTRRLRAYEQQSGHQFAVLTLSTLEGEPLEEFSIRVVEAWELGKEKADDGLLLLVVVEDRKVRIEVGYGLEGAITDAHSSRVIRDVIGPALRQGQYAEGIDAALVALMRTASGDAPDGADAPVRGPERPRGPNLFFLLIFFAPFLLPLLFGRRGRYYGGGILMSGGYSGGTGGGFSGGGFSGGGGGFGGGGASGSW